MYTLEGEGHIQGHTYTAGLERVNQPCLTHRYNGKLAITAAIAILQKMYCPCAGV